MNLYWIHQVYAAVVNQIAEGLFWHHQSHQDVHSLYQRKVNGMDQSYSILMVKSKDCVEVGPQEVLRILHLEKVYK